MALKNYPLSQNVSIQTSNIAHAGVYLVTITATIPLETAPGSETYMSDTVSFSLTVIDACDSTELSFSPPVVDMLAYVGQGADT